MLIMRTNLFRCAIFVLTVSSLAGCAHDPLAPHRAAEQGFKSVLAVAASPIFVPALLHRPAAAKAYPLNELPMFGNLPKTSAMIAADNELFANAEKQGTSRQQSSDKSVQLGWQYFSRRDFATAMKRFNQAYLFDPNNGDAFHGFAVVVMDRDHDAAQADDLFKHGLAKQRQSPGIYLDYGRFLLSVKKPAEAVVQLQKALSFPTMGADAQALLTIAYAQSGDVKAACTESLKLRTAAQKEILDVARAVSELPACATP